MIGQEQLETDLLYIYFNYIVYIQLGIVVNLVKVGRIKHIPWLNVISMHFEQITASALEIDFGALAASLNCVSLHKRLDISADGIHVCIFNTVFLLLLIIN